MNQPISLNAANLVLHYVCTCIIVILSLYNSMYMLVIAFVLANFAIFVAFSNDFQLYNTERSEGFRVERISRTGQQVNFTWFRRLNPLVGSWFEAVQLCHNFSRPAYLPQANDVRYFYKTLRSDDVLLPNGNATVRGVTFYLQDVLEATMDYANMESGERMCFVVEKRPNSMLHLSDISAIQSCTTSVNLVICKHYLLDSAIERVHDERFAEPCLHFDRDWNANTLPVWIDKLKRKASLTDDSICVRHWAFYVGLASIVVIIVGTIISFAIVICRCRSTQRRLAKLRLQTKSNSWSGCQSSMPTDFDMEPGGLANATEMDGKLDILADSNFQADFNRQSYKNALMLQSPGYQRMPSGRFRTSRINRIQ